MHAGQLGFVGRIQDAAPVRHDGPMAAVENAHGPAMDGHIVEPEPQLGPHAPGRCVKILQRRLNVHVTSPHPLIPGIGIGRFGRSALVRGQTPPQMHGVGAQHFLGHFFEIRMLDDVDVIRILVRRGVALL